MSKEQHNALPKGFEFEGYRIDSVLGSGGFGITYLATEIALKRRVAIKEFMPAGIAMRGDNRVSVHAVSRSDEEYFAWGLERFRREASTLVGFRHPNIVRVHRYYEHHGTAYMVMEYEEGRSLDKILRGNGRLEEAEIRELLFPLLDGLTEVHRKGFLHRDIKPGNIYVREDGSPVLLDFGAARYALGEKSRSLTSIVSEGYTPPEQYEAGGNQGPWTDIYALGAVLYRAVAGEKPVAAPRRLNAIARGDADPLRTVVESIGRGKYSAPLMEFIERSLAVREDDRPQSIASWLEILPAEPDAKTIEQRPLPASPEAAPARRGIWFGPWPGWAAAGVVLCLIGAAVAADVMSFGGDGQDRVRALRGLLDQERGLRGKAENERRDLAAKLAELKTKNAALDRDKSELTAKLSLDEAKRRRLEGEERGLTAKLSAERAKRQKLEDEKRDLTTELAAERADRKKLAAEKRELEAKLGEVRSRIAKLEKEKSDLQAKLAGRPSPRTTPDQPTARPDTPPRPVSTVTYFRQGQAAFKRRDYRTAYGNFLAAARRGYAPAQAAVGLFYESGVGGVVGRDVRAAVRWYRRAAAKGNTVARRRLAALGYGRYGGRGGRY